MECSLPGVSVRGIFQARILEGVAISSSRGIFPTQGWEVTSPALAGRLFTTEPLAKPTVNNALVHIQKSLRVNILRVCIICVLSHFSCVRLFATLWTVANQAPLSMGFSRQEYWSGLPSPPSPPRALLDPGIKPVSLGTLH